MKNRTLIIALLIAAGLTAGIMTNLYLASTREPAAVSNPGIEGLLWPHPRRLESFTVLDHHGQPFGLEQLSGKWSFVFFGYTHCPDACPNTLAVLKTVYEKLGAENLADDVQVILASVDPARDTPAQLANYVRYFNEKFIGLTGTPAQVTNLTRQLGVVFYQADNQENYIVDHSVSVFLIGPDTSWVGLFSVPHRPDELLARYKAIRRFLQEQDA